MQKESSFLIRIFVAMKKLTIWIVSVIIGVSFLGLLMLQMHYIEQMVKMRKEQFDESVIRSLNQASRNLEQNETFRYLERFTRENPNGISDSLPKLYIGGAHNFEAERLLPDTVGRIHSGFELKTIVKHPSTMPKVLRVEGGNRIDEASRTFREYIKNAYVYHKGPITSPSRPTTGVRCTAVRTSRRRGRIIPIPKCCSAMTRRERWASCASIFRI